jgi:nitroimidazol reductase NimA-like FMN-containing flavoprotein (pyridoxamine 5'-phosphate oxidase superfamily)
MLEPMQRLLKENHLCVLATSADNVPHCSLMTYVTSETGDRVYMLTRRGSKKYTNLTANPQVSLLIDTRSVGDAAGGEGLKALTVSGDYSPIHDEAERQRVLRLLVEIHPQLGELADLPDAEPVVITVRSFLLLDGVLNASFHVLP